MIQNLTALGANLGVADNAGLAPSERAAAGSRGTVSAAEHALLKQTALLGVIFFTLAGLSLHYLSVATPVWTSNAVSVAFLIRSETRNWRTLLLGQFLADLSATYIFGTGLLASFVSAGTDIGEVLMVAIALHKLARSSPIFSSIRQISLFGLICASVPLTSATGGALVLNLVDGLPFIHTWTNWYLGDAFGLLIITPFLLMWTDTTIDHTISDYANVEVVALACLVGVVGWIDFSLQTIPGVFLSFPFLLLAAFRGGLLGATTAAVALTAVASWLTLHGVGPLAAGPDGTLAGSILNLELYLGVVLLSTLPVAVMLEQRKLLNAATTLNELARAARHDVLTGLANRMLFQERLARIQAETRRNGGFTAIVLLDLDRFKPINDLYGHAAGDRLLQLVAERVSAMARQNDTVARLGGDEFAIVGHMAGHESAHQLTQRIMLSLVRPFEFNGLTVQIGCSAGIVLNRGDVQDPDILVQRADSALYRAKGEGRNCLCFFEPGMDAKLRERATLEMTLRDAIESDDLVPHYQPIVDLATGAIVGFEMLARWTHATMGEISPAIFVPVAESIGLIGIMTEQLLRRACLATLTWPEHLFISVNISPVQLRDRGLPQLVHGILEETGLAAWRVEIELTETALIDDFPLAREILVALKRTGVRLVLDDFGTGYSSLRHLQGLPLDKIKIDMGFVNSMMTTVSSYKIVAAVIGLGHSLGLPIVAEGIEDTVVAQELRSMGCDLGQGWLYGPALPKNEVLAISTG